jgi:hypothetical protein
MAGKAALGRRAGAGHLDLDQVIAGTVPPPGDPAAGPDA